MTTESTEAKHSGVVHWRWQRLSGVLLLPVALLLVFELAGILGADYSTASAWAGKPLSKLLLVAGFPLLYLHGALGVQVVIEDYVGEPASTRLIKGTRVLAATAAIVSVLAVFFAGG
ncbi:MAG: succinate dehydrogenase, hydrophobic membrane anchor protein [Arenicellales bacterium]|nr:succinate dehydrogenase, hydrophobic membrane anchor protein [Arenicellales bacterium]